MSIMSPQDEQRRRTSLLCLYTVYCNVLVLLSTVQCPVRLLSLLSTVQCPVRLPSLLSTVQCPVRLQM